MPDGLLLYCLTSPDNSLVAQGPPAADSGLQVHRVGAALAAVVGCVDPATLTFDGQTLTAQQQARLIELACWHDTVINRYAEGGPVLPVRFGAVFSSSDALAAFVCRHEATIRPFLDRARTHAEWLVKLLLARDTARQWCIADDPELAERAANLPRSPGARYLLEKRLHQDADTLLRQHLDRWREQLLATVGDRITQHCPLPPTPIAESDWETVAAWAMLVGHQDQPTWAERLHQLSADWEPRGLQVRLTGPWPAYHFAPQLAE
jgi:hypothetical protein